MAGTVCNFATQLKFYLDCDDALDIFASHGVGGLVGNILTAIFAQKRIAAYDGSLIKGGWLDRHYMQLAVHLADSTAGLAYSFIMTTAILWAMHFIPPLRLRVLDHVERVGIDESDMGEFAYDYVGPQSQSEVRAMAYGQASGYELRTPEFKESIVTQF